METLKQINLVHNPDERNLYWGSVSTGKPITIEDRHAEIASIAINASVTEAVRSYFATLQNLCLYAWFSYDLYGLVVYLNFILIEMALRLRLPAKGKDRRTLEPLLREAIRQKLIDQKAFAHIQRIRQQEAEELRRFRRFEKLTRSSLPKNDYLTVPAQDDAQAEECIRSPYRTSHPLPTRGDIFPGLRG
jgi:hypothetical protein